MFKYKDIVVLENMRHDEDYFKGIKEYFESQGIDIDEVIKLPPKEMFARLRVKESFGDDPRFISAQEGDERRKRWLKEH